MDHMTFDEFKEVLAEDLKESLYTRGYEDVEIGFNHTNKANVEYEAMTIKPVDGQIGINFNIEGFYQEYEKGVDYSELRHAIADLAAKSLDNAPEVNTNVLTDYEQMKDKLSLEVISKKGNEAFLENIPHKDLEDMAVYYRFVLDVHTNGEMQSITVTNNMLENYGITADKLHEDAIANAPNYRPAVIKTMTDTLREMMGVDMFDMFAEGLKRDGKDVIFVASTEDKVNGAGILAYPEFLKDASERLEGDFFVLPSSRHEVILAFCGEASEDLRTIFSEEDLEINGYEDFAVMWGIEEIEELAEEVSNCWNDVLILCGNMSVLKECQYAMREESWR